jgi:transposase-like protein
MDCPHCASTATKQQTMKTRLGSRRFRCESRASELVTSVQERRSTFWNSPLIVFSSSYGGGCGPS